MFLGIITENRDGAGLKGALRWGHSWLVERPWRREIDVVFAMGQLGVDWLVSVGYPPEKVFPFGYVVDQAPLKPQVGLATEVISFVFVGRLDRGKNVALLLNSFLRKGFDKCRLIVVGDGPERSNLEQLVAKSKYGHVVQFTGVLKNSEVWDVLGKADCLVLPSRYDGWGAVINEALLSGARVIVSDRCGAATVVRDGYNGRVFRSGSVESLVEALKSVRAQGPIDATTRMDLIESASVIKEKALVTYFLEVVRHAQSGRKSMRPIAPWLF